MLPNLVFIDLAMATIGLITLYLYLQSRRRHIPLPPGPKKLPIIGNVLDIPTTFPSKGYDDLCKKYKSDIIHLNAFGNNIIAINSYEAAQELLEKRSLIYSSRPRSIMVRELGGYDFLLIAMPYDSRWRTQRRLFSTYFHQRNTGINQPREIEHVHVLLQKLLETPESFASHIRHMIGAISLSEAYGLTIKSENDPYIALSEQTLEYIVHMATQGAFLVETFKFLKYIPEWFPGTHFKQYAKKAREISRQVLDVPFKAALDAMHNGTASPGPSLISEGIQDIQNRPVDPSQYHQHLKEIGVMTYLGALDTTEAALNVFILCMMLFPGVQRTAQQELDRVLGDRLPDHSDIPAIPYITALVMEILRWEATIPSGFPHLCTEDDVYKGYYIPKGSIILPLQRSMLHNERDYPEPHVFKPERFIKNGIINEEVRSPDDIAFGFGRRKCPGLHLAKSSMWITIASVLSTFNIGMPLDKDGRELEPTYKFNYAQVNHLEPFTCSIKPRSAKAASVVNSISG